MASQYIEVTAITSLPDSHYLYEAQIDLQCAGCNNVIPVNSYFARRIPRGSRKPLPHCRECRPIKIYTSPLRTRVAAPDKEYLYVEDAEVK
jgi:hypothetical protein